MPCHEHIGITFCFVYLQDCMFFGICPKIIMSLQFWACKVWCWLKNMCSIGLEMKNLHLLGMIHGVQKDIWVISRDLYDARLSNICNVAKLIINGEWGWPTKWNAKFPRLNQITVPNLQENMKDEAVWVTRDGILKMFGKTCSNEPKVMWKSMVWFTQCRYSLIYKVWTR